MGSQSTTDSSEGPCTSRALPCYSSGLPAQLTFASKLHAVHKYLFNRSLLLRQPSKLIDLLQSHSSPSHICIQENKQSVAWPFLFTSLPLPLPAEQTRLPSNRNNPSDAAKRIVHVIVFPVSQIRLLCSEAFFIITEDHSSLISSCSSLSWSNTYLFSDFSHS